MPESYLTAAEVAKLLQLDVETVYILIRKTVWHAKPDEVGRQHGQKKQ